MVVNEERRTARHAAFESLTLASANSSGKKAAGVEIAAPLRGSQ